jgi:hypothetical protein
MSGLNYWRSIWNGVFRSVKHLCVVVLHRSKGGFHVTGWLAPYILTSWAINTWNKPVGNFPAHHSTQCVIAVFFLFQSVGCRVENGTEQGILYTHVVHVTARLTEERHIGLIVHTCPTVLVRLEFLLGNVATFYTLSSWKIWLEESFLHLSLCYVVVPTDRT